MLLFVLQCHIELRVDTLNLTGLYSAFSQIGET